MRAELIENPTFLRYYEKWQNDPTSVVFAPISEIFRTNGMIDDAIKIAEEGLKHHPTLISGHLALAKAYLEKGEKILAKDHAIMALEIIPTNAEAKKILDAILSLKQEMANITTTVITMPKEEFSEEEEITEDMPLSSVKVLASESLEEEMEESVEKEEERSISDHEAWYTVTMARILAAQGHTDRAKKIYKIILDREPANAEAQRELENL